MTQDKKLKQQIRERSARTGESYATARRQTLAARARKQAPPITPAAAAATKRSGAAGAVSDAKCVEKTGHGLQHWFGVLDSFDAAKKGHAAAAKHLRDDLGVSPWYSQGITVAYERARGLRAVNQACSGGFEVSVSRMLPATLEQTVKAIGHKSQRQRWMPQAGAAGEAVIAHLADGKQRFRRKPNKALMSWSSDGGRFEFDLSGTEDQRCRLVVRCTRLPEHSHVEVQRGHWRQWADALRSHLKA